MKILNFILEILFKLNYRVIFGYQYTWKYLIITYWIPLEIMGNSYVK
jgi:hypothetical protein